MDGKFITPIVRISYPHIAEPQPGKNGGKPKYSAVFVVEAETLLIAAEKALLTKIQEGSLAKGQEKFGPKFATLVKSDGFKKGFRTDVEGKYPAGSIYFSARAVQQPTAVFNYIDPETGKPARVPADQLKKVFYPGANVRGLVSVFAFDQEGNKGLSFGLEGLQFISDNDRMDGRVAAEDAFTADLSQAPASLDDL